METCMATYKERKTAEFKIRCNESTKDTLLQIAEAERTTISKILRELAESRCASFLSSSK